MCGPAGYYPKSSHHRRPRRLRRNETIRRMVRETTLGVDDLVLPLFVTPGRGVEREPGGRHAPPSEEVAERDEVDVVVGVEVADDDRIERERVAHRAQPAERPLPEVEDERVVARGDEVAGADRPGRCRCSLRRCCRHEFFLVRHRPATG